MQLNRGLSAWLRMCSIWWAPRKRCEFEFSEKLVVDRQLTSLELLHLKNPKPLAKRPMLCSLLQLAVCRYKSDKNPCDMKPETRLLALREGLELVDSSVITLKREVAEGVDIMVVRELTGGNFQCRCTWLAVTTSELN